MTGHDGDEVRLLVFPNIAACVACRPARRRRRLRGDRPRPVREAIARGWRTEAQARQLDPACHARVLLAEPPSIDAGEITDKGYINQRAVLTRRAAAVAALDRRFIGRMDRLRSC